MNDKQQPQPIGQVIADTEAYFSGDGYTEGVLHRYRYIWQRFAKYAEQKSMHFLSVTLCRDFMREEYGFEMYTIGLKTSRQMVRRPILALLEFQEHGFVSRRCRVGNRDDYAFPSEYSHLSEKFFEDLSSKGLAPSTVQGIRRHLLSFTRYLIRNQITDLNDVSVQVINEYAVYLTGYCKSSIYSIFSTIRKLLKYTIGIGVVKLDITGCFPIINKPSRLSIPVAYSEEEIERLLSTVDRGSALGKRTYAMLLLGIRYGLRSSDIRGLKLSSLSFTESKITLTQYKTDKQISFDMLPDIGWALIDYLKNGRPQVDSEYVFLTHKVPCAPFSEENHLWQIINKHMRMAGLGKAFTGTTSGFHSLRHSLAGNMLKQEIPLTVIKEVLGHENLYTTMVYTKIDVPQLKACALEVPI